MCLYKGLNKMQVAKKDITCYKIIEAYNFKDGNTRYQSYFQETNIVFGSPLEASKKCLIEHLNTISELNEEVVHAFVFNKFSNEMTLRLKECTEYYGATACESTDIIVIECTIPKGTWYCLGYDDGLHPNYGALTIVPNKVITILATVYR